MLLYRGKALLTVPLKVRKTVSLELRVLVGEVIFSPNPMRSRDLCLSYAPLKSQYNFSLVMHTDSHSTEKKVPYP